MKYLVMLLLLASVSITSMGCEASGKVEDNDEDHKAKVKIEAD